jgi:hypothetical protein
MAKISGAKSIIAYQAIRRGEPLVRNLQKIVQQSKFVHYLERGWMHGVAAKIAKEVPVFFENYHFHSRPRQQIPEHNAGRSATDDTTRGLKRFHLYLQS